MIKMSSSLGLKTFLFVSLFVSAAFGPGFQSIPVFCVVNLVLGLSLFHLSERRWEVFLGISLEILGQWLAYCKIFGKGFPSLLVTLALATSLVVVGCLVTIPLLVILPARYHRFSVEKKGIASDGETGGLLILPVCVTAFFSTVNLISPTGSWASFAYAGLGTDALIQSTSLFGIDAINFFLSWTASLLFYLWVWPSIQHMKGMTTRQNEERNVQQQQDVEEENNEVIRMLNDSYGSITTDTGFQRLDESMERRENVANKIWRRSTNKQVERFAMAVVVVSVIGGARTLDAYGKFFQRDIQDWNLDKINAVCLAGYEEFMEREAWLDKTRAIAEENMFLTPSLDFAKADLILWSETSLAVHGTGEEDSLIAEVKKLSNETGAMIAFGYSAKLEVPIEGFNSRNMFALVDQGKLLFKYQKVHPVVGVEADVQPGTQVAPVVSTRFGNIGGGICFDFDFPNFIRAASNNADIMLQAGWDWGPIGFLHAHMDALRAVENGFTLFRCSSGGVSGVYDPYGNVVTESVLGTNQHEESKSTMAYTAQIPRLKRVWTLYHHIGGALGYLCVLIWLFFLLIAVLPMSFVIESELLSRYLRPMPTVDL